MCVRACGFACVSVFVRACVFISGCMRVCEGVCACVCVCMCVRT